MIMNWYEWNIREVKQALKSMMETLRRLGIPLWLVTEVTWEICDFKTKISTLQISAM